MSRSFLASVVASVFLSALAPAQMRVAWERVHDSPVVPGRDQHLAEALVLPDSSILLVEGVVATGAPQGFDVLLARYDAQGLLLGEWEHDFVAGYSSESPFAAVVEPATGLVVVSGLLTTFLGPTGTQTVPFVARFTTNGAIVNWWQRPGLYVRDLLAHGGAIYSWTWSGVSRIEPASGSAWDRAFGANVEVSSVIAAPDGDLYATGAVTGGAPALRATRLTASNAVAWTTTIPSPTGVVVRSYDSATDASGNLYVTADLTGIPAAGPAWIVSFDPAGSVRWSTLVAPISANYVVAARVVCDGHGRVLIAGGSGVTSTQHLWVLDAANGAVLSTQPIAPQSGTTKLAVDARGNATALLQSFVPGETNPGQDMLAVGLDARGDVRWSHLNAGSPGPSLETADALRPLGGGWLLATYSSSGQGHGDTVLVRLDASVRAHCFGDGSEAACPCANASSILDSAGCRNSLGTAGRLVASGDPSIANDTLLLAGDGMSGNLALYVQGTASTGAVPFGDGLRCVNGTLVRLGTQANVGGASQHPSAGGALSTLGGVTTPGVRHYFAWYRNAASFCTSASFNVTNALEVTWAN